MKLQTSLVTDWQTKGTWCRWRWETVRDIYTDFDADAITESVEDICEIEENDSTYMTWYGITLMRNYWTDLKVT